MSIDVVCVACGRPSAAHPLGRCPDTAERSSGFILLDSRALEHVPPAERRAERERLAKRAAVARGLAERVRP